MQAVVVDPKAPGHLKLGEAPDPQPDSHQAVLRVRALSLNRGEVRRAQAAEAGTRIGWDIAGVIVQAAKDGSGPKVGTRVVGISRAMYGWAERCALPTRDLAPIPEALSFEEAATLPVAGLTALYGLERGSRLLANRVLITGASGGTGWFACGLARLMGATVVAHVRKEEHADMVREAGAHEVVVHPQGEGIEKHGPYRLIFDGVGGDMLTRILPLLTPGGRAVLYGVTAGTEATLTIRTLMMTGHGRIEGFYLFPETERVAASDGLARLGALMADGRLHMHIDVQEDWATVGETAQALLDRRYPGKAVLTLPD